MRASQKGIREETNDGKTGNQKWKKRRGLLKDYEASSEKREMGFKFFDKAEQRHSEQGTTPIGEQKSGLKKSGKRVC